MSQWISGNEGMGGLSTLFIPQDGQGTFWLGTPDNTGPLDIVPTLSTCLVRSCSECSLKTSLIMRAWSPRLQDRRRPFFYFLPFGVFLSLIIVVDTWFHNHHCTWLRFVRNTSRNFSFLFGCSNVAKSSVSTLVHNFWKVPFHSMGYPLSIIYVWSKLPL